MKLLQKLGQLYSILLIIKGAKYMDIEEILKLHSELNDVILDRLIKRIREYGEIEGLKTKVITKQMLKNNKVLLSMNLLELVTEAAELANSIKSFKYWSKQEPDSREHILEELADVLLAAAAVANNLEFTAKEIEDAYREKVIVNKQRQKDEY